MPPASVNITNDQSQWKHLAGIELQYMNRAEIKVILGSDVTEIIMREGPGGSPFGIKTKVGWTATGKLSRYSRDSESVCFIHVASPEEELNELVKTWWRPESFGCKYHSDERRSKDELILESLEKTSCKVDGRYQAGLI